MGFKFNPTTGLLDLDQEGLTPLDNDIAREIRASVVYGEAISALKLIYIGSDGRAYIATNDVDYDSAKVAGISLEPGIENDTRDYLIFGRLDDAFFAYVGNLDLFLGSSGSIIAVNPESVGALFYKRIGQSLGTGSIFLDVGQTKIL